MGLRYRLVTIRLGHIGVVADAQGLRRVHLPQCCADELRCEILADYPDAWEDEDLLPDLAGDLCRYFAGQPVVFSVPVHADGASAFARAVWDACRAIPYGQTMSYKALASRAGRPAAARAVGLAMARNPCPIVIPCHRVVGSNGALRGYSGPGGIEFKRLLLDMETGKHA
jgi:methylated-DNA-[protein]-cysteine S-methyltransferase